MPDEDISYLRRGCSEIDVEWEDADVEDDIEDGDLSECDRSLMVFIWCDDRIHPESHEYRDGWSEEASEREKIGVDSLGTFYIFCEEEDKQESDDSSDKSGDSRSDSDESDIGDIGSSRSEEILVTEIFCHTSVGMLGVEEWLRSW